MPVNTGHETEPNRSANCLGDLSLVNRPETSLAGVLDTAHRCHVLGHDGEVLSPKNMKLALSTRFRLARSECTHLVVVERVHVQSIKCICGGTVTLPPLLHLDGTQIMRRIDITSLPFSGLKSLQNSAFSLRFLVFKELLAVRQSTAREVSDV